MADIDWNEIDPIDEHRIAAIEDAFQQRAGDSPVIQGTPRELAELAVAALNDLMETEREVRAWQVSRDDMSNEEFRRLAVMLVGARLESILRDEAADEMRSHHADALNVMRSHKQKRDTIAHMIHSERAATFKDAERALRSPKPL